MFHYHVNIVTKSNFQCHFGNASPCNEAFKYICTYTQSLFNSYSLMRIGDSG